MLRRSFTATVARNELWEGEAATEPYEASWATEAIFFVRALEASGHAGRGRVQISPDGIHWCDEGTSFALPARAGEVTFGRVSHFGGYLRLAAEFSPRSTCKVIVALSLK
jgi:hypothetical protein